MAGTCQAVQGGEVIKVSRKSEYTGMFGVQHICDRCGKIIYFADTSKKPVGNEIDICKTCAVELWNKEKEEK